MVKKKNPVVKHPFLRTQPQYNHCAARHFIINLRLDWLVKNDTCYNRGQNSQSRSLESGLLSNEQKYEHRGSRTKRGAVGLRICKDNW